MLGSQASFAEEEIAWIRTKKIHETCKITFAMLMNPSPRSSIATSPSTASVPLLTFDLCFRSSSTWFCIGHGFSRTSKIRSKFERATTTLQMTCDTNSCLVVAFSEVESVINVEGVDLTLVTNSTRSLRGSLGANHAKACRWNLRLHIQLKHYEAIRNFSRTTEKFLTSPLPYIIAHFEIPESVRRTSFFQNSGKC